MALWNGAVHRVRRGGSFAIAAFQERSAYRRYDPPSSAGDGLGVRPARGIDP